ncbi:MAG TPA: NAD(P)/FAD-dependent oxidoreductase [bacterium (Candidatus Stahlbacteria)]|nr:NAD(P)/FAD-dependent oxidoreductase [Candidatus Stahlbacteria bacterium]
MHMQSGSRVILIIGGGPAGVSCAIQLKRYGLEPVIFEKNEVGGLMKNANLVENYLGFPEGISGSEFAQRLKRQIKRFGVKVYFEKVNRLDHNGERFALETNKQKIGAEIVVIASGTRAIRPLEPKIPEDARDLVLSEIYPILDVVDRKIAIIGAGDAAFDNAKSFAKRNDVIILNRGEDVRCLPVLWQTVRNRKVDYRKRARVTQVRRVSDGLMLTVEQDSEIRMLNVDYLILAIGREPELDFLGESVKKNLENLKEQQKLFMIGDVKNGAYRQVAIATGDGVRTAMEIYRSSQKGDV